MPHKDLQERSAYKAAWYYKNQAKIKAKALVRYKADPLKKRNYQKQYATEHIEEIRAWRKNNPDKKRNHDRTYRRIHRIDLNKKRRLKLQNNPSFKLACNIRSRISGILKGTKKSDSTFKLLGCTLEELWKHLEIKFHNNPDTGEEMKRSNYGRWHHDHIIPCIAFDLKDLEQQRKCFHYTNLQPLWAKDNLSKGAKYES